MLGSTQERDRLRRFDALVPLSWITHHIGPSGSRRVSIFFFQIGGTSERPLQLLSWDDEVRATVKLWFRYLIAHILRE